MRMSVAMKKKLENLRVYLSMQEYKGLPLGELAWTCDNTTYFPSMAELDKFHLLTVVHTETVEEEVENDDCYDCGMYDEVRENDDGSVTYVSVYTENYYGLRED